MAACCQWAIRDGLQALSCTRGGLAVTKPGLKQTPMALRAAANTSPPILSIYTFVFPHQTQALLPIGCRANGPSLSREILCRGVIDMLLVDVKLRVLHMLWLCRDFKIGNKSCLEKGFVPTCPGGVVLYKEPASDPYTIGWAARSVEQNRRRFGLDQASPSTNQRDCPP